MKSDHVRKLEHYFKEDGRRNGKKNTERKQEQIDLIKKENLLLIRHIQTDDNTKLEELFFLSTFQSLCIFDAYISACLEF